jgi:uncharacterized protein (DUF1015 family)
MVLIDDPENTVIGPVTHNKQRIQKLYDFELMMGSGHLSGFRVTDRDLEKNIIQSLQALAEPEVFAGKYGLSPEIPVLLFAMGDGNHSLATAKTIWDETKKDAAQKAGIHESSLRYALVELVNLHDEALVFEPIHRVLYDLAQGRNILSEMESFYSGRCHFTEHSGSEEMLEAIDSQHGNPHKIGVVTASSFGVIEVSDPDSNLPVGTLQNYLDVFLKDGGAVGIDYIHGTETLVQLGQKTGSIGFYLPAMDKHDLFKTVILDGALPRKTFSMGEAWEKRFYMEARRLS